MLAEKCCKECRQDKLKGNMTKRPVHVQIYVEMMLKERGHRVKMARTKTNTQNITKHAEHQDATYIQNQNFFRLFQFYFMIS